ncbi:MAG TPA: cytochrome b N-terminal domain-containing protein [Polyangia bacterium]|jgi:quinol-cytochrome oxidoreductase complex cytochrome b subunit
MSDARSPRAGLRGLLGSLRRPSFVAHLHPPAVRPRTLQARATYGLGVAAVGLGALLAVTGVLLMFYYVPTAGAAHASLQDLAAVVPFGGFVRSLHRVAAHAMVVVVALHLARVVLAGADRPPRTGNAWIGLALFALTLGLSFTGYLLPWDQRAYWACTVGADLVAATPGIGPAARRFLLGGDTVGGAALLRFYALHVAALPALGALLTGYHLWRVRKDGGLAITWGETP